MTPSLPLRWRWRRRFGAALCRPYKARPGPGLKSLKTKGFCETDRPVPGTSRSQEAASCPENGTGSGKGASDHDAEQVAEQSRALLFALQDSLVPLAAAGGDQLHPAQGDASVRRRQGAEGLPGEVRL